MKSLLQYVTTSLLSSCVVLFSSCSFFKKESPVLPTPPAVTQIKSKPVHIEPTKAPITRVIEFDVDAQHTTGIIDLVMDPKGSALGLRKTRGTSPLEGTIKMQITEDPNTGKREVSIQDMNLTNTRVYDMDFIWNALVGKINMNIAPGVLEIIPNDFSSTGTLGEDKKFTLPDCYFTVLGHSRVKGSGLVLKKAVGDKQVNITMQKTEPVNLQGTIEMNKGSAILRIPNAVLRKQFDLDGTQLGLVFTADITATAQNL